MNDVDPAASKRSLATPSPPSSTKRPKQERYDTKLDPYTPPPLPLTATHGVERIPLPPALNVNRLPSRYFEQLVTQRTEFLRRQGKHVVDLPVVLNDGIALNWVRPKSGSVDNLRFYQAHTPLADHLGPTRSTKHSNEELCFPVSTTGNDSGTSPANAIIVDSDEVAHSVSFLPRADMLKDPPTNRATPLDQDVISHSDSDVELLEGKADGRPATSYRSVLPLARDLSPAKASTMSSNPPPTRALTREKDAVALHGLCSASTDSTISDSEVDATDNGANDVEGVGGSGISARHAKPPSLPSLQPIRRLLAGRQQRGDPERGILTEGILVASGLSRGKGRKEFFEEAPAIMSSESDEESDCRAVDPQLKRVPLPKTDHGRARRLLVPETAELPLVAVTMRGDCHFIERRKKFRITGHSLPNPGVYRHVDDVCMVGDTAVLGCDKGTQQISFLSVAGKPQMIDVARCPHSNGPRYQDTQRRGVSRLAAIHAEGGHIKFLSGGYDGTIHEWTADVERLNEPHSRKVVSHGACVMALAYRDRDRSVAASTHKKLHITDLNRCRTMMHSFSNEIQQIHIHPQAAYVTLLEIRHLDRQVHLYDSRKAGFDSEPCLSFGHRNTSGKFSTGHTRGSVHLVHFARASEDGTVLLWDFRNGKRAVVERRFEQAKKVVHTIFADRDIATFGENVVTFFEDYLLDDVRGTSN